MKLTEEQKQFRIDWAETWRLACLGDAVCRILLNDQQGRGCLLGITMDQGDITPHTMSYDYAFKLDKYSGIPRHEILDKMAEWDKGASETEVQEWLDSKMKEAFVD